MHLLQMIFHTVGTHNQTIKKENHMENKNQEPIADGIQSDYNSIRINDYYGQDYTVKPHFMLYSVTDYLGRNMAIPGIHLTTETADGEEPFAVLTKSFGEFLAVKDCAYVDTNNYPFADEFLKLGIAQDTGFTKQSGFCTYPLWKFNEDFWHQIGGEEYEKYSQNFDDYMRGDIEEEIEDYAQEDESASMEISMQ